METVKTIKDVDDDAWHELKSLASRNKMKLGQFIELLLSDYQRNAKGYWKQVLQGGKVLTDREANELESILSKMRKESGFRV